jgi:branched-chain amino acid transport system permease protein
MSVIGGIASIWGAPFGVAVTLILKELIRTRMHAILRGAGGEHEVIAFGVLIVVIMLFLPEGLTVGGLDLLRKLRHRWSDRHSSSETLEEAAGDAGPALEIASKSTNTNRQP